MIGSSHIGSSTGIENFLSVGLKDISEKIIKKIRSVIKVLKTSETAAGKNSLETASKTTSIRGPAIRYTLEKGTSTAKAPSNPNIAPLAPTAGVFMSPKISPAKIKNIPPTSPEIMYIQKNLFFPTILSKKLPMKNKENMFAKI
jgi:hypothetical protein